MTPDDPQQRIIRHLDGALLVLAPVGSGKTYALIERLAAAIEAGRDPSRMLCLTFTNRAAEEVRGRLDKRFPSEKPPVVISTFHGLCANILRAEARFLGIPTDFTVCDDLDARDLLAEITNLDKRATRDLYTELHGVKSAVEYKDLTWPLYFKTIYNELGGLRHAAVSYQEALRSQHLLDFSDLVLFTNAALARVPQVRARWMDRFDMVMVDEIQDTHRSEYRVVYVLARTTGNLAFFGDVSQTIYEWRGSAPDTIIDRFEMDFGPVTRISLDENRRSTPQLLAAAESFASATFRPEGPPVRCSSRALPGPAPVWCFAADPADEAEWIADRVGELQQEPEFEYRRVGVLTANNYYGIGISQAFAARGVPHLTVGDFDFFQRRDVKDALALLRLLCNPNDLASMHRVCQRLIRGVGRGTLSRIMRAGEGIGLERVDLLKPETHSYGEPFARLIDEYRHGRIVVLDIETTGLHQGAEMVEIAATVLEGGAPTDRFETLVRNQSTVGDSVHTHGLTDEYLARFGQPLEEALPRALQLIGDSLVVGHNIAFDLRVLRYQSRALGLEVPPISFVDTLLLAQRFLKATDDYTLAALAQSLGLANQPAHRAGADVKSTVDLLARLMEIVPRDSEIRRDIVQRDAEPFVEWADQLDYWRGLAQSQRPARVASQVMAESGLRALCEADAQQLEHLDELLRLLEQRDDEQVDPWTALERIVRSAALVRYVDQLLEEDDRIPVLTIHQAKGLEFDTVFIAGLHDGELPRRAAVLEGRLLEEQRLFYVALTRARRRLFLSAPRGHNGRVYQPSPFIQAIDASLIDEFMWVRRCWLSRSTTTAGPPPLDYVHSLVDSIR